MTNIKPIETIYNGYRFRSRLEARWAVFFDNAHIIYEYEPEGFDLEGEYYLPDFFLPDFSLYVEIKPFDKSVVNHVGDGNKWEKKCRKFRNITGQAILLCYGYPSDNSYHYLFAYDLCDSSGGSSEYYCAFVIFDCKIVLCTEPERVDRYIYLKDDFSQTSDLVGTPSNFAKDRTLLWNRANEMYCPENTDILNSAKTAARQARFEHGENSGSLWLNDVIVDTNWKNK